MNNIEWGDIGISIVLLFILFFVLSFLGGGTYFIVQEIIYYNQLEPLRVELELKELNEKLECYK